MESKLTPNDDWINDIAFLSSEPMTDEEFKEYVKFGPDKEVSIDEVDFKCLT